MSDSYKRTFNIGGIRDKVKNVRKDNVDIDHMFRKSFSWQAISEASTNPAYSPPLSSLSSDFNFSGKVLRGGQYAGEDLRNASFSGADLKEVNFTNAQLQGADFSGADLSGADLSGANLNNAIFSGAKLRGTNFTGAKMNGVILVDADIQDAILLNVEMDNLALEELQSLIEYLAVYYPHKLNLTRLNLTMLDFSRIDLSRVNLRGVDFTGVDFTGVNIFELDLSECIISPEQIAQALGRMPTPLELKRILAPKKKKAGFKGIDLEALFFSRGTFGVWDLSKHPGVTVAELLKMGKKLYNAVITKPDPKDEEILAKFHKTNDEKQDNLAKEHNEEMRKLIEERKRNILESGEIPTIVEQIPTVDLRREKEEKLRQAKEKYEKNKRLAQQRTRDDMMLSRSRGQRERG